VTEEVTYLDFGTVRGLYPAEMCKRCLRLSKTNSEQRGSGA
jgi:hypothetical protein